MGGFTYSTPLGSIQILGLAELGPACMTKIGPVCDACYMEDLDNQIDICLSGDEAAVATITHVYTPSGGDYLPFYNPGGPGIDPDPDTVYTAKSTFITTEVINALDDPMTVSLCSSLFEPAGECDNTEGNYICCPPLVCHATEQVCVRPGNEDSPKLMVLPKTDPPTTEPIETDPSSTVPQETDSPATDPPAANSTATTPKILRRAKNPNKKKVE